MCKFLSFWAFPLTNQQVLATRLAQCLLVEHGGHLACVYFWFPLLSLDNKEGTSTVLEVRNLIMYWFLFRYKEQSITFLFLFVCFVMFRVWTRCYLMILFSCTFRTLYVRLNIKFSIPGTRLKSACLIENLQFLALSLLYELDKLFSVNIAFSISN